MRADIRKYASSVRSIGFEFCSFIVQRSCSRGAQTVPGVAEHAISTRPISALLARVEAAERGFSAEGAVRAVVVGGGAAGIELAMALQARK